MRRSARSTRAACVARSLALAVVAALIVGCGGGAKTTTSSSTVPAGTAGVSQASGAGEGSSSDVAAITRNWQKFFDGSSSTSERVALLQDGQRFAAVIQAQSKNPLATQSQAKVSKVTLTGSTQATVVYTVLLAGKPALPGATGTAVKSGGSWQVSDRSFCALLELEGGAPAPCTRS